MWLQIFVILLYYQMTNSASLSHEDSSSCHSNDGLLVSVFLNETQCFSSTTDHQNEINNNEQKIFITFLGIESHYHVTDFYEFYEPEINDICECSCSNVDGECSEDTKAKYNNCANEISADSVCLVYNDDIKNSSLCHTSKIHKLCCQVRLSVPSNLPPCRAFTLEEKEQEQFKYFYNIKICDGNCSELLIPNEESYFSYGEDRIIDFIPGKIDGHDPKLDTWYAIFDKCLIKANGRSDFDSLKPGWFRRNRQGGIETFGRERLEEFIDVKSLSECDKTFKGSFQLKSAVKFPNGIARSQTKLHESFEHETLEWPERLVIIKRKMNRSLGLRVLSKSDFLLKDADAILLTYVLVIEHNSSEICLNLTISSKKEKNITITVFNGNFKVLHKLPSLVAKPYPSMVNSQCHSETQGPFLIRVWSPHSKPYYVWAQNSDDKVRASTTPFSNAPTSSTTEIVQYAVPSACAIIIFLVGLIVCLRKKCFCISQRREDLRRTDIHELRPCLESGEPIGNQVNYENRRSSFWKTRFNLRESERSTWKLIIKPLKEDYLESLRKVKHPWMCDRDLKLMTFQLRKFSSPNQERIKLDEMFSTSKASTYVILGAAGSGKTTLVHKILWDWAAKSKNYTKKFKLILFLRQFEDKNLSLEHLFNSKLKSYSASEKDILQRNQDQILIIYETDDISLAKEKHSFLNMENWPSIHILLTAPKDQKFWMEDSENSRHVDVFEIQSILSQDMDSFIENFAVGNVSWRHDELSSLENEGQTPLVLLLCGKLSVHNFNIEYLIHDYLKEFLQLQLDLNLNRKDYDSDSLYDTGRKYVTILEPLASLVYRSWKNKTGISEQDFEKKGFRDQKKQKLLDVQASFALFSEIDRPRQNTQKSYEIIHDSFRDYLIAYHLFLLSEMHTDEFSVEIRELLNENLGPSGLNDIYIFLIRMLNKKNFEDRIIKFWDAIRPWASWYRVNRYDNYGNQLFYPFEKFFNPELEKSFNPDYLCDFLPTVWEVRNPTGSVWPLTASQLKRIEIVIWDLNYDFPVALDIDREFQFVELIINFDKLVDFEKTGLKNSEKKISCTNLICSVKALDFNNDIQELFNMIVSKIHFEFMELVLNRNVAIRFLHAFDQNTMIGQNKILALQCELPKDDAECVNIIKKLLSLKDAKLTKLFLRFENVDDVQILSSLCEACVNSPSLTVFSVYCTPEIKFNFLDSKTSSKSWDYLGITYNNRLCALEETKSAVQIKAIEFVLRKEAKLEENFEFLKKCQGLENLTCFVNLFGRLGRLDEKKWKNFGSITHLTIKFREDLYTDDRQLGGLTKFQKLSELSLCVPGYLLVDVKIFKEDLEIICELIRRKRINLRLTQLSGEKWSLIQCMLNAIESYQVINCGLIFTLEFTDIISDDKLKHLFDILKRYIKDNRIQKVRLRYQYQNQMEIISQCFPPSDSFNVTYELDMNVKLQNQIQQGNNESRFWEYLSISLQP